MPRSTAWDFFTISVADERFALCNVCKGKISRGVVRASFSTSPLRLHLKNCHPPEYQALLKKEEGNSPTLTMDESDGTAGTSADVPGGDLKMTLVLF